MIQSPQDARQAVVDLITSPNWHWDYSNPTRCILGAVAHLRRHRVLPLAPFRHYSGVLGMSPDEARGITLFLGDGIGDFRITAQQAADALLAAPYITETTNAE